MDDRSARASVEVARVGLAAEEGKLVELRGQIAPQEARVQAADARVVLAENRLKYALRELERAERLSPAKAISVEELDQRSLNVAITESQANEARAVLRESKANLDLLNGDSSSPTIEVQILKVKEARANLLREETLLSLHTVTSPINCQVLQVKVRPGEFVPAAVLSTPLITLGVVAPLMSASTLMKPISLAFRQKQRLTHLYVVAQTNAPQWNLSESSLMSRPKKCLQVT